MPCRYCTCPSTQQIARNRSCTAAAASVLFAASRPSALCAHSMQLDAVCSSSRWQAATTQLGTPPAGSRAAAAPPTPPPAASAAARAAAARATAVGGSGSPAAVLALLRPPDPPPAAVNAAAEAGDSCPNTVDHTCRAGRHTSCELWVWGSAATCAPRNTTTIP